MHSTRATDRLHEERPVEGNPELVHFECCQVVLLWGEAVDTVLLPEDKQRAVGLGDEEGEVQRADRQLRCVDYNFIMDPPRTCIIPLADTPILTHHILQRMLSPGPHPIPKRKTTQ